MSRLLEHPVFSGIVTYMTGAQLIKVPVAKASDASVLAVYHQTAETASSVREPKTCEQYPATQFAYSGSAWLCANAASILVRSWYRYKYTLLRLYK